MVYYFPPRPIYATIRMRREGWMTYLFTSVVLIAPTFDLDVQAPRRKVLQRTKQTFFFYTILLSRNISIYDELDNNRHAYSEHIGMRE
jgi:hypothetical protein